MVQNEVYFKSYDDASLYLYRWSPNGNIRAVLHIVHGMAEHALRYRRLAEKLTAHGIEVWACDQRGHGKTADPNVNSPDRGGLLGYCSANNGNDAVTLDIHAINAEIRKTRQGIPIFLMGHSWGSFITQNYIEKYSSSAGEFFIDGCILSGTKGNSELKVLFGIPFLNILSAVRGKQNISRLAWSMADGGFINHFKPNRTPYDWLSRDTEEVDKYAEDPLCGFVCTAGFYRDLAELLNRIYKKNNLKKINKNLPVYVFSGNADPVGNMGAGPTVLVNNLRKLGLTDLEFVLYPGARHETLNETNRDEVIENLLSWIKKHCLKAEQ